MLIVEGATIEANVCALVQLSVGSTHNRCNRSHDLEFALVINACLRRAYEVLRQNCYLLRNEALHRMQHGVRRVALADLVLRLPLLVSFRVSTLDKACRRVRHQLLVRREGGLAGSKGSRLVLKRVRLKSKRCLLENFTSLVVALRILLSMLVYSGLHFVSRILVLVAAHLSDQLWGGLEVRSLLRKLDWLFFFSHCDISALVDRRDLVGRAHSALKTVRWTGSSKALNSEMVLCVLLHDRFLVIVGQVHLGNKSACLCTDWQVCVSL